MICLEYVTKLVMYKTCSPVMYQLRVHTAGACIQFVSYFHFLHAVRDQPSR